MANSLNIDVTGMVVVIDKRYAKGSVRERMFRCRGGFGCKPYTSGSHIYGYFLVKGVGDVGIEGYMIERLANEKEMDELGTTNIKQI